MRKFSIVFISLGVAVGEPISYLAKHETTQYLLKEIRQHGSLMHGLSRRYSEFNSIFSWSSSQEASIKCFVDAVASAMDKTWTEKQLIVLRQVIASEGSCVPRRLSDEEVSKMYKDYGRYFFDHDDPMRFLLMDLPPWQQNEIWNYGERFEMWNKYSSGMQKKMDLWGQFPRAPRLSNPPSSDMTEKERVQIVDSLVEEVGFKCAWWHHYIPRNLELDLVTRIVDSLLWTDSIDWRMKPELLWKPEL